MSVAWRAVKDRLVAALPAVIGTSVKLYDGPVVTGETPSAYLTIGTSPGVDDRGAGTFTQTVGPDGFDGTETGTVVAELAAVTGSTAIPDVFTTFAAITSWVQADMTLGGVLSADAVVGVTVTVVQAQTRSGAVQRLALTFDYTTQL